MFVTLYLHLPQDLPSALIAGGRHQRLERAAAHGIGAEGQQVGGAELVQAVHQQGSVFEAGQSLNQPRAVITYGQRLLGRLTTETEHDTCVLHTTDCKHQVTQSVINLVSVIKLRLGNKSLLCIFKQWLLKGSPSKKKIN